MSTTVCLRLGARRRHDPGPLDRRSGLRYVLPQYGARARDRYSGDRAERPVQQDRWGVGRLSFRRNHRGSQPQPRQRGIHEGHPLWQAHRPRGPGGGIYVHRLQPDSGVGTLPRGLLRLRPNPFCPSGLHRGYSHRGVPHRGEDPGEGPDPRRGHRHQPASRGGSRGDPHPPIRVSLR